jgi:hypothetical protein
MLHTGLRYNGYTRFLISCAVSMIGAGIGFVLCLYFHREAGVGEVLTIALASGILSNLLHEGFALFYDEFLWKKEWDILLAKANEKK